MIACWTCRNLERFVQVSERADAREIVQTAGSGVQAQPFDRSDGRPPGLYCATCGEPVEGDLEVLGLIDDRLAFVLPGDFRADELHEELLALRPDASWSAFDVPAQAPVHRALGSELHPLVLEALERTGRLPLYAHQAEAIDAALRGEHVVQATPAGSGKSIGLVVPVLDDLLRQTDSTAILAYPLRALANDQLNGLQRLGVDQDPWVDPWSFDLRLAEGAEPLRVARLDGSTPDHVRTAIRRDARILITTPDMLHVGVVGQSERRYRDNTSWHRLLSGMSTVVLDEVHSYQGVFGSNVGQVLRRLRRVVAVRGARPRFLAASATIGNPAAHASRLTGVAPFTLVDRDGSGRSRRVIAICNPPERRASPAPGAQGADRAADPEVGGAPPSVGTPDLGRIAPQTIAIDLIASALDGQDRLPVRTIAFARSRNAVFQLAQRSRSSLKERRRADLAASVAPYAATFLAQDRVEAEDRLRDGSTLAIVSTSALELGIDIPDLSLAVLVGYPGQISSFRQRSGRVGRSGEGLAVLIVGDDPLQQYLARNVEALRSLIDARAEDVVINPDAPEIAKRFGLLPAQAELGGISFEDAEFFGPIVEQWLEGCTGPPDLTRGGIAYWRCEPDPESGDVHASLRNASGGDSVSVLLQSRRERREIGTIDRGSAPRDCFVPAIWTGPDGDLYEVVGFDERADEVYCEGPVDRSFQTRGMSVDTVAVGEQHRPPRALHEAVLDYSELEISRMVWSYVEQHFSGLERRKDVERRWPPTAFRTDGLHLEVPPEWVPAGEDQAGTITAVEHLLLAVAPALVACDPADFDATSERTTIYLYDSFGGGLRMSEAVFDRFDELAELAHRVVSACPCESGCPSCVMLARRPDGNANLSKTGAIAVLARLVERRRLRPNREDAGHEGR